MTPMKTPNHPAMKYKDMVTAALRGLCGHHGSDSSGQPNQLEIKLQTIRVSPPYTVAITGKAGTISTGWSWSPKIAAIASVSASAMRPTMKNMGVGFWPGYGVIRP